jgi:hypothetical protein
MSKEVLTVIASTLGIVVTLLGGLNFIVKSAITSAMVEPGKAEIKLQTQLNGIQKDVDRLKDRDARATFQSPPTASGNAAAIQIKDAADWAIQRKIEIAPIAIQKVSSPLFSNDDIVKWEAATSLVNLRSFVNSTLEEAKQHIGATYSENDSGSWKPSGPDNSGFGSTLGIRSNSRRQSWALLRRPRTPRKGASVRDL